MACGLPLSTAHRLLQDLTAWNLLERTNDGDYRPGLAIRAMGTATPRRATLAELGRLLVEDLSEATGAQVRLGVLHESAVAFMEKQPGRHPVSGFSSDSLEPIHATAMGKALLAFSPTTLSFTLASF